MAPKPMPWFRFYSEARRDVKIKKAAREAGVSLIEAVGFWSIILSIANESPVRGYLNVTTMERFSNDDIAIECNEPLETVERLLFAFEKYEMICNENGGWKIVNWEKRQYLSDKSTERVRKLRENRRSNGDETLHRPLHHRFSNGDVTSSESDTESDTEEEERAASSGFVSEDFRAEQIYRSVTGQITFPSDSRGDCINAIRAIASHKGGQNETVAYLRPFFTEWKERHYAQTNTAWLTVWAVAGQIPERKESSKPTGRKDRQPTEVWD